MADAKLDALKQSLALKAMRHGLIGAVVVALLADWLIDWKGTLGAGLFIVAVLFVLISAGAYKAREEEFLKDAKLRRALKDV